MPKEVNVFYTQKPGKTGTKVLIDEYTFTSRFEVISNTNKKSDLTTTILLSEVLAGMNPPELLEMMLRYARVKLAVDAGEKPQGNP